MLEHNLKRKASGSTEASASSCVSRWSEVLVFKHVWRLMKHILPVDSVEDPGDEGKPSMWQQGRQLSYISPIAANIWVVYFFFWEEAKYQNTCNWLLTWSKIITCHIYLSFTAFSCPRSIYSCRLVHIIHKFIAQIWHVTFSTPSSPLNSLKDPNNSVFSGSVPL